MSLYSLKHTRYLNRSLEEHRSLHSFPTRRSSDLYSSRISLRGRSAASLRQNCVTVFSFSKNHFSSPSGRWSIVLFFFSSRRRHTRCGRDWSSDVCSSDLRLLNRYVAIKILRDEFINDEEFIKKFRRSEERRVGKECRFCKKHY